MLAHDPLSPLAYPMITYTHPAAGNLPIKTLVAKQQPTKVHAYTLFHLLVRVQYIWDKAVIHRLATANINPLH